MFPYPMRQVNQVTIYLSFPPTFPLHVPQRRTRAGPAQLLHIPTAHEANKDTIRRGLFRRAVLAFNEHVDKFPDADPFRATPASSLKPV